MKDKEGNVIVVNEENAADVARKEMALEKEGKDPENEIVEDLKLQPEEKEEKEEEKEEKEEKAEDKKEEKEEESKAKTPEELIAANPDDLDDDEKQEREELIQAEEAEEKRLLEAKEEELSAEDKEKKKTALLKIDTKKKAEFDTRVEAYAKEKEVAPEEARKTLESAGKISEKYSNDPEQIAIANLGLQQLVATKDEEIRAVKEEANQPRRPQSAGEWEIAIKERGLVRTGGGVDNWETVVKHYREKNEKDTEGLEDDQVLRLVAKEIHLGSKAYYKEQSLKAKTDANEKRDKLVTAIPEKDKQYADEVKSLLKTVPDSVILNKDYTIEHSLRWARGGYFTPDKVAELEKAAELKGFERGQASKKIISGPTGKSGTPKSKGTISWSEKEKEEASDMFPNVADEKERYKLWKEIEDSRAKNRKKKEG